MSAKTYEFPDNCRYSDSDEWVRIEGTEAYVGITDYAQSELSDIFRAEALKLPDEYYTPRPDCYARRLLHRDPQRRYTAVVMTWGPGQQTPLHDHAGIWCVEGVLCGEMNVTRHQLIDQKDELYQFARVEKVQAGVGASGSLIPPFEHHVLGNALQVARV